MPNLKLNGVPNELSGVPSQIMPTSVVKEFMASAQQMIKHIMKVKVKL